MKLSDWTALAVATVKDPASAARALMDMSLPREVLWVALVLAAVLNTLVFSLSNLLLPTPTLFPPFMSTPIFYFAVMVLGLAVFVMFLTWAGRFVGGTGRFEDVMVLVVWLQFLRVLVQMAALVLVLTVPILSVVLVIGASLVGIYILLQFVSQAHGLKSLGKAALALVLTMFAMVIALSLLLALVGGPITGSVYHV